MFSNPLRGFHPGEWAQSLEYLTPSFFEIVPTIELSKVSAGILKNFTRRSRQEEEAIRQLIRTLDLPVEFRTNKDSSEMLPALSRKERGHIVLSLLFGQLLNSEMAWLDLRASSFEMLSKECIWKPSPWIMHWDAQFLTHIRDVLTGFFTDNRSCMEQGLNGIHLESSIQHFNFGATVQRSTEFSLKAFRSFLHKVFVTCKQSKTQLHPQLFPLAILFGAACEHLESLDLAFDVRRSFEHVSDCMHSHKDILCIV